MRFKAFLEEHDKRHEHEHFVQHIAEEELVACKIHAVTSIRNRMDILADCNDMPREKGLQEDLSKKMAARMKNHPHIAHYKPRVYHEDLIPDEFETVPSVRQRGHKLNEGDHEWKRGAIGVVKKSFSANNSDTAGYLAKGEQVKILYFEDDDVVFANEYGQMFDVDYYCWDQHVIPKEEADKNFFSDLQDGDK